MTEPPTTATPLPPFRRHPVIPNVIESLTLQRLAGGRNVLRLYLPGHPDGAHQDLEYRPDDPRDSRASLLLATSRHINAGTVPAPGDLPPLFAEAMRAWAFWLDAQASLMELKGCAEADVLRVEAWADQLLRLFAPGAWDGIEPGDGLMGSLPTFKCPTCKAVSYNPGDIAHRYCGRCRLFADDMKNGKAR